MKANTVSYTAVGGASRNESILYLGTSKNGELWVGTDTLLARWRGSHFEPVVATPRPILSVAWPSHGLAVATLHGLMLFAYTAPSSIAPEHIRFRFRLAGWDRNWIDAGAERVVSYTGLPPGNYNFKVEAKKREAVSGNIAAIASLQLKPFFWQAGWFRLLILSCIVALVAEGTRQSTRRHAQRLNLRFQERAVERERIAYQLHDTVVQDIVGVAFKLKLLVFEIEEKGATASGLMNDLATQVRGSIARSRNMLSSLHSTAMVEYSLAGVMRHAEAEFLRAEFPVLEIVSEGAPRAIPSLFAMRSTASVERLYLLRSAIARHVM